VDWSVTGRPRSGSIPPTILTLFALYILGIKGNASPPLITTALGIALIGAVVGAVIILLIWGFIARRRRPSP